MIDTFKFFKKKYGTHLLIDILRIESLGDYFNLQKPYQLTFHMILLVNKGESEIQIDNKSSEVSKGSVVFVNPMQISQWKIKDMIGGLALIFEEEFLSTFFTDSDYVKKLNIFQTNFGGQTLNLNDGEMAQLQDVCQHIEKEILNYKNRNIHLLRALLYQGLSLMEKEYASQKKTDGPSKINTVVIQFEELVEDAFKTEHAVSYYANELAISVGYLNNLIKESLHITAKQYITNRLFLEAKRLLNYSSLSISEIAWRLNFEDESYFVRAFKKYSGYTPKSYRKLEDS